MTTNQQLKQERLQTSIDKCLVHLQRLQYATTQTEELFPLTVNQYNKLTEALIGNIDQMVFRFIKLQDETRMF